MIRMGKFIHHKWVKGSSGDTIQLNDAYNNEPWKSAHYQPAYYTSCLIIAFIVGYLDILSPVTIITVKFLNFRMQETSL